MTKLLQDILNQPRELIRSLHHNFGPGRAELEKAAGMIRSAGHTFVTGIGSSWHAGMAVQSFLHAKGRSVTLVDASELLYHVEFPQNSVLIALSRSGKSIEIVRLMEKAAKAKVPVIAVTNTPDSPLAKGAAAVLWLEAAFDHCVSITMFSALGFIAGLAAAAAVGANVDALKQPLESTLIAANERIPHWQKQIESSDWFDKHAAYYFLGRGASASGAFETRLLWEEAAKAPATAMTTGGFRHGPQEMITRGTRIGMWIDPQVLTAEDLALALDLRGLGCRVMLIGQELNTDAGDLVLSLPKNNLPEWQFLVDAMPAQLAGEAMARRRGVDPDSFRICSYIIDTEGGLKNRGT